MELVPDGTYPTDWLSDALCVGSYDRIAWHWSEAPSEESASHALSVCASCPVRAECLEDMIDQNEGYRYQVRAGLKMWEDNDLPSILRRPRGMANKYAQDRELSQRSRKKDAKTPPGIPDYRNHRIPPTGAVFNPHTRGPHNTPIESETT